MTNAEIINSWRELVVSRGAELDDQAIPKPDHNWHSLWTGFVLALGRADLTSYNAYIELGFPVEMEIE